MPNQVNLDRVVPRGELTLGREELPEEVTARLKEENRAAIIGHCKDVAIFAALYLFLIAVVIVCFYLNLWASNVTPETLRWSQALLTAVLSGTVSFLVGRKIGK